MRNVWLLLQAEIAGWKNRRKIIWIIVLIVFMIGTFSYVREQETEENVKISLGLANEDQSQYAELLLQYFNENEVFLKYVELVEDSEKELEKALGEGRLDAYLVIPENFAESMIDMENLPVKGAVSMQNPTKALVMRHVMDAYETYIEAVEVNCTALYRRMKEEGFSSKERNAANMEISLELIFTALGKDDLFRRQDVEVDTTGMSLAEHYKYTGLYFVMLFFFIPAGLRVLSLKKNGLPGRLRSMNVTKPQLITAVGIPYLVLILCVFGVFCFAEGKTEQLWQGLGYVIPWLLVMLLLGELCTSNQSYLFVCSMLMIGMAVLGGSLIPESFLPEQFLEITKWMPNRNFTYVMGGVSH